MKSGKRIWSALLALFLVFGMIVPVSAEDEITVTAFSVEPVTMIEGADLTEIVYDDGTSCLVYDICVKNPFVSVTYSSGESYTYTVEELMWTTDLTLSFPDGLEQTADWAAAETPYLITVDLYDPNAGTTLISTQVEVTILPNPVESFSVEPMTMTEGVDTVLWDDENGNEVEVYYFPWYTDPKVTVTFNDGRAPLTTYWSALEYELDAIPHIANEDVLATADWEAGEHTIKASFMGKTCDVAITVKENPVASASVAPVTAFDGQHTYKEEFYDPALDQLVSAKLVDIWALKPEFTLTLKDGSTVTGNRYELDDDGYRVELDYEERIKTKDWEVGKTYTVPMAVNGCACPLEVTFAENPVASVEVLPVTIGTSQSQRQTYWDDALGQEVECLYYPVDDFLSFKVTYKAGTEVVMDIYDMWENDIQVSFACEQDQYTTPWLPGNTYKVFVSCFGYETEALFTIEDDSLVEISAKAQKPLYEGLWDRLHRVDPLVTLKFANGKTKEVPYQELYDHLSWDSDYYMELETTPEDGEILAAGTHNVILTIDDLSCTFPITVKENPISSFRVSLGQAFVENVHGSPMMDESEHKEFFWYAFELIPFSVELTLKDGTVETYSSDEEDMLALAEKYNTHNVYPVIEQQYGDIPGPGTYKLPVHFMGMKQAHTIHVVGSTIQSITGSYNGTLLEGVDGYPDAGEVNGEWKEFFYYNPNFNKLLFTVTYTDGTSEVLGPDDYLMGNPVSYYVNNLVDNQTAATPWTVGKNKAVITILDFEVEVEIEVVKNDYKKLTITNDNGLTLKVEKTDGTVETHVAYDFIADYVGARYVYGLLVTDKGSYTVSVDFSDDALTNITYLEVMGLVANKLKGCTWFSQQLVSESAGRAPQVSLDLNHIELKELVAGDDEDVTRVWLRVNDITDAISTKQEALLKAALEDKASYKLGDILDLTMYQFTEGNGSDEVTELDQPLTIRLELPAELAALENLVDVDVLRIHKGEVEVLDGTVKDGYVSFQTDRFSTYALVYSAHYLTKVEGKEATTTAEGVKEHYKCSECGKLFADAEAKTELTAADVVIGKLPDPSNPQTGDNTPIAMLMVLAIASGLLLAGTAVFGKKRSW